MTVRSMVVGTDGSETASMVVRHAARLASALDAVVHLVSAYRSIAGTGAAPFAPAFASERADAESILMEALEVVRRADVNNVRTHAVPGDPAEALLQVAEIEHAQLIVIGNKGLTGARRFLLGSVPDKLSHHADCHVMIVRSDIDRSQPVPRRRRGD